MWLRTFTFVALVGGLTACASSGRTESASSSAVSETANTPTTPVGDAAAAPASSADHVAQAVVTRIVTVEEVTRAKRASAVAHPHDHRNFNRAQYVADPDRYLSQVAGGRIYEVSNPAADVDALAPAGARGFSVPTNGEATLAARTEPGMPVTFTSFGLGEFPASGLQSISVAADEHGVARAQFRVTPGTVGSCLVTAGSPVRANTLNFLISIPETP